MDGAAATILDALDRLLGVSCEHVVADGRVGAAPTAERPAIDRRVEIAAVNVQSIA